MKTCSKEKGEISTVSTHLRDRFSNRLVSIFSEPGSPIAPPRKWKADDIYESLPGSLKSELVVRTREMVDPEELERRKEIIRTQSPAQLSEICSLSDLPVPKFISEKFSSKQNAASVVKSE